MRTYTGSVGVRTTAMLGVLMALAAPHVAVAQPNRPDTSADVRPYFDSRAGAREQAARGGTTVAAARPSERTSSARAELRRELGPEAVIAIDPLTGTPRQLLRTDGGLSASRGGDRAAIAMDYVAAHRDALGLDDADIAGLDLQQRVPGGRGLTVVRFRQLYKGIPAFDNDLRIAIDSVGRVISVAGAPRHDLSVSSVDPNVGAAAAMAKVRADVGEPGPTAVESGPSGVRQKTTFAGGDFARLVLFGAADGAKLAWHVLYHASRSPALYDAVVDASSGAVLYRQNLTKADAAASVYPNHPGASAAQTVDLEDYGLPAGAAVLSGQFSRAFSDVDDNDEPAATEEVIPSSGSNFVYPFQRFRPADPDCPAINPCAWNPVNPSSWKTNRSQNAVQAFYLVSRFHDHLAGPEVLFTDDWGNFELGGTGGDDPVSTQTDDGAATGDDGGPDNTHRNNANMSTPPDGLPPRMQMYLFVDSHTDAFDFRSMNGGDDSGVVWHEYTHGLSNRLVTNADGSGALSTAQAGAMGEAWSDWFASDFQELLGLKTDDVGTPGEIDVGEYSDADPHTLRSQALDCPVGVADPACPGGALTGLGGYTYGDFGKVAFGAEVHADGEIWAETLWDLRQALQIKAGNAEVGIQLAEILVSDGMRFSPPEPTMLDMRNAILGADQADFGGQLHDLIWDVFRARGLGYFAAAADGSDTTPVEDFSPFPDAAGAKGTVTGVVTDSDSGLPIAGVKVGFGGHTTDPGLGDYLADTTDARGRYTITGVPVGTYPKLAFIASAGYNPNVARSVVIDADATTTRNAALVRDWAALSGGATIESVSDDTGSDFGCGVAQALDQSQGTTWSAFNPSTELPDNPHAGPPTVTIKLPETIDVATFLIDPSAGCGDGASATTRQYKVETSADGASFQLAVDGTGAAAFTDDNIGKLNELTPAGTTGKGVRYVRVTLLSALRVDPECGEDSHCSGTDFIDLSEFEVLGGLPNTLPSGSLAADKTSVLAGETVAFDASSFTDPDSKIVGYDWDFDGDGTVDRTTTQPKTSYAYPAAGSFVASVAAKDFRGGAGKATRTITVTGAAGPPPGPAGPPGEPGEPGPQGLAPPPAPVTGEAPSTATATTGAPTVRVPRRGTRRVTTTLLCAERCTVSARLRVGKITARRLGLRGTRTVRTFLQVFAGRSTARQITLRVPARLIANARRRHLKTITAAMVVEAAYGGGRATTVQRTVVVAL